MAKSELEQVTEDAIHNGGILAKIYFDKQSEKQEDLQPLMTDLIGNRLLKEPGVIYCVGDINEPIQTKDTYSTSAIATVLVKDLGVLINITVNYVSVAIEILR